VVISIDSVLIIVVFINTELTDVQIAPGILGQEFTGVGVGVAVGIFIGWRVGDGVCCDVWAGVGITDLYVRQFVSLELVVVWTWTILASFSWP